MPTYHCDPNTEIIGQQALAFVENMSANTIRPYLEQRDLTAVDPMTWYPLQAWLDVLNELAKHKSATLDYVAIGTAMTQTVWLPAAMARLSMEEFFLTAISRIYQMQYRNGSAGSIEVQPIGTRRLRIRATTPYPDDLTYGVVYGFALRFLPRGTPVKVEYDPGVRRRDQGGEYTTMILEWE